MFYRKKTANLEENIPLLWKGGLRDNQEPRQVNNEITALTQRICQGGFRKLDNPFSKLLFQYDLWEKDNPTSVAIKRLYYYGITNTINTLDIQSGLYN